MDDKRKGMAALAYRKSRKLRHAESDRSVAGGCSGFLDLLCHTGRQRQRVGSQKAQQTDRRAKEAPGLREETQAAEDRIPLYRDKIEDYMMLCIRRDNARTHLMHA